MAVKSSLRKKVRRPQILIVAATALAVLLFVLVSWHNYQRDREQVRADSQGDADRALVAVDAQMTRLIEDADSYVRVLRAYYLDHGIANEAGRETFLKFITQTRFADTLGFVGEVAIIDASGHPIFTAPRRDIANIDLSDLSYFKSFRADPGDRLIIDPTRLGRTFKEYQFRITRPIWSDGQFRGVILVSLRPDALVNLFNQFALGPNSSIAVVQTDAHQIIARVPVGDRSYFGKTFDTAPLWGALAAAPRGTYHVESQVDHKQRYNTYVKSADLPIASIVGVADIDVDESLAITRQEIRLEVVVFAVGALVICGLMLRLFRAEGNFRRAAAGLEHAQQMGRIGSVEIDLVERKVVWSKEVYSIYGRDPELGPARLDEFLAYIHPDDRANVDEIRAQHERGIILGANEYRIVRPDGQVRWIHREVQLESDNDGTPLKLYTTEQDITDRRNMEFELRRANEILMFAQRMAHIGSAEIGLALDRAARTDEYYRILGIPQVTDTASSDPIIAAFHPDDQPGLAEAVRRMNRGEPVESMELRILRPNGEIVWVRRDQDFIRDADGKPESAVVTLLDITDSKRLEIQKDEFVSTVSHELRTPLTSIRGALALLKGGVLDSAPDKARTMIDVAHRNSERLSKLVDDLLDVQRIQAGRMVYYLSDVAVSPLVADAIEAIRPFAARAGVEVRLKADCPNAFIHADPERIGQVMANLLSNAIKFSGAGQTVEIDIERQAPWIRITVEDHGPGIPEEFRSRIFQRFAQSDSSDTRQKGGSGLGLNIVAAIVAHHKGRVSFDSVSGQGTRFHVDLAEIEVKKAAGVRGANSAAQ